jgi:hypothetical protein
MLSVYMGEYEGNNVRVTEDGRFSVYDVLVAFVEPTERKGKKGENINPRQIYKSITEQYPELVQKMDKFKFPGRGQRETPVANEEGIYQILMLCPGRRGAEFRGWAAKIVRERREEENNPELALTRGRQRAINSWKKQGLSDSHIEERLEGIQKRLTFTDHLKNHGVTGFGYAQCTNAIYLGLFEATAISLKEQKGISKTQNLRDYLDEDEVREISISEDLAALRIKKKKVMGNNECAKVSFESAQSVKNFLNN